MTRVVTAERLRRQLGRELDALRETEPLYVSKRDRFAGVLLDPKRYAELIERLDYLEDSLAASQAREGRKAAAPWAEVREWGPLERSASRRLHSGEFRKLQGPVRDRARSAIDGLRVEPRPVGCMKLAGRDDYRVRVGEHRVVYAVDDAERVVIAARIAHRRDVYRA